MDLDKNLFVKIVHQYCAIPSFFKKLPANTSAAVVLTIVPLQVPSVGLSLGIISSTNITIMAKDYNYKNQKNEYFTKSTKSVHSTVSSSYAVATIFGIAKCSAIT